MKDDLYLKPSSIDEERGDAQGQECCIVLKKDKKVELTGSAGTVEIKKEDE